MKMSKSPSVSSLKKRDSSMTALDAKSAHENASVQLARDKSTESLNKQDKLSEIAEEDQDQHHHTEKKE